MEEKKKTTTKRTTKKKVEVSPEKIDTKIKEDKSITMKDIPLELMQQMFSMFQEMMVKNKSTEEEVECVKPSKINKAYLRKIKDKEVAVRSVAGLVVFKSPKSGIAYKWTEVGDEEVLSIDEVLQMDTLSKRFLRTPWLIIDDKEVVEGLELTNLYKTIELVENVDMLLEMEIDEIKQLINKAPHEYKQELSSRIFEKVNSNQIRDIVLIRELESMLGVTLLI